MKMLTIIAGLAGAIVFTSVAFAAGNSTPGGDRYKQISSNPNPDAQCGTGAGSGSFGYFGKDGYNFGAHTIFTLSDPHGIGAGANGYQTGLNNSAVCGNRQPN